MSDERGRGGTRLDDVLAGLVAELPGATVLDVGGGSGTRAVPLAALGRRVTVVDTSADALAILRRRALDSGVADAIDGIQADVQAMGSVVPAGSWDLVICHHLLETVDDPAAAAAALAAVVRPGGLLSVLVAGRYAAVLAQSVAGRFDEAAAILGDPDGRFGDTDPLARRFDATGISELLQSTGLSVEQVTGIGVVSGVVSGAVHRSGPGAAANSAALDELEERLTAHPVLLELGADLHVLARRPG